jgi:hypothetical protein
MPLTVELFDAWLTEVQKIVTAERPEVFLDTNIGKKFIKVISYYGGSCSVFAFIDKTTGDILKPATFKAPAKHARGNILDEFGGLKYITAYGPMYLEVGRRKAK